MAAPNALAGQCRLSVHAPGTRFDLAVPTDVLIADLLPTVVGYAGEDLDEEGLKHGGWVLQRLGERPLASDGTAESLGLHDGEVVHLRPHRDALPPVHFDDLVHGVMSGLRERADSWRPACTRALLVGLMLTALGVGVGMLSVPGALRPRVAVAAVVAVLLMTGAAAASRVVGDAVIGTALGGAGTAYVVVASVLAVEGGGGALARGWLLAAGAAAVGGSAVAFAAVGVSAPLFLGSAAVGALAGLGGVLAGMSAPHAAAVVALVIVVVGAFVPAWGFWLAGLRLPPLPANADQLQEGIEAFPAEDLSRRGVVADRYVAGLLVSLGAGYAVCLTVLADTASGWGPVGYAWALSGLAALHGRTLGSVWHRLAVVLPGVYGIGLLLWHAADSPGARLVLSTVLALTAAGLAAAAWTVPGRRMVPHWARAADIAHTLLAVSLPPLLLLILGVYHALRGVAG